MEKTINEKLTDGTFLTWIKSKDLYTTRIEKLFQEWTKLKKQYKYMEYDYLLHLHSSKRK